MHLPDPRRYGNGTIDTLAGLAEGDDGLLAAAVAEAIASGKDADIRNAYAAARTRDAYRRIWEAVIAAVEARPPEAAVVTRVFAMPWLLVCGTRQAATLSCVLPDPGGLVRVLEENGALGGNRNLGFANALTGLEALEAISPTALRGWALGDDAPAFPPAPVTLTPGDETVHLRFLPGAAVTPVHAPAIAETAANIAAWGMRATAAISPQLAVPGVTVLAMPRPPLGIMRAAYAGRRAVLEAASSLFLSNTLRRFRLKVGDASMTLSCHEGGELRVTLHSSLDEGLTEGYRWPLHPLDDLLEIAEAIVAFARECRITDIAAIPDVLPDTTINGALLFPTARTGGARH